MDRDFLSIIFTLNIVSGPVFKLHTIKTKQKSHKLIENYHAFCKSIFPLIQLKNYCWMSFFFFLGLKVECLFHFTWIYSFWLNIPFQKVDPKFQIQIVCISPLFTGSGKFRTNMLGQAHQKAWWKPWNPHSHPALSHFGYVHTFFTYILSL